MAKSNEVKKGKAFEEPVPHLNIISNEKLEVTRQKKRGKIVEVDDLDRLFDNDIDEETLIFQDEIEKIGIIVRSARRDAKLSQAGLAKLANVARSTVASVEGGYVVGGAQYGTIVKLLYACGRKITVTVGPVNRNVKLVSDR